MFRTLLVSLSGFFCLGCSLLDGSGPFSPPNHTLMKDARKMRQFPLVNIPNEAQKTTIDAYYVEPGDGLLLLPVDLDSPVRLPSDQTVSPDGTIDLGKYGKLKVTGMTLEQIEAIVLEQVKKITPDSGFIDVRLVNRQSKQFYVLGEVQTPGKFPYTGNETVLDAILQAGGLKRQGSRVNVILVRPGPTGHNSVFAVNYNEIVQLGDTTTNYQLMPGDRVYVPSKKAFERWGK